MVSSPVAIFDRPSVWRADEILRSGLSGQDRMIAASPGPGFPLTLERLVSLAQVGPGQRVVDIGSGLGGATMWLAEASGAEVTGVEPVHSCRTASRRLFPELNVANASLETMSPTDDYLIDVVTALGVISLSAMPERAVAGLVELVRPSGYIAVVDLVATRRTFRCGPDIFVTSRILACLFEGAGADVVCVQATPATPSEWADVDDATTAAVATRHAGEADFEDWERDRRTLRALQHAELIRPVLVIAKRRSNPSN
jgi:SAM-dependent methyltransferase